MAGNFKINIPKGSGSPSPKKRGVSALSHGSFGASPEKKRGFPTTPRAFEKQKKILAGRLKKAMDDNIRLHAHNRCLKERNIKFLDMFASTDTEF